MKLSVCIDAVFRGVPAAEAMRLTREAGYDTYEFWGWWDKDLEEILEAQRALGLTAACMCTRFFSLVDPAGHRDFLKGLQESVHTAHTLGCRRLIAQTGQDTGLPREAQLGAMVDCLRRAASMLEGEGVTLLLEPLNHLDHPGYYLTTAGEAVQVLQAVDSPNIRMLFDLYHQQITEGDLIRRVQRAMPLVGHFHAAGNPGRGELGEGELNYRNIFSAIRGMGYGDCIGLEFFPRRGAGEGLREALSMFQPDSGR